MYECGILLLDLTLFTQFFNHVQFPLGFGQQSCLPRSYYILFKNYIVDLYAMVKLIFVTQTLLGTYGLMDASGISDKTMENCMSTHILPPV